MPKAPQKKVQCEIGRGLGRTKASPRGTPFASERDNSSGQVPLLSGNKRSYNSAAMEGNKSPTTSFIVTMILQLEVKCLMYLVSLFIGLYILCRRYYYFVHCLTLSSIMV